MTGSVLFCDATLDLDAIRDYAQTQGLFQLTANPCNPSPLTRCIAHLFDNINHGIHQITKGHADVATLFFFLLVGLGICDIAKRGIRPPPWYTAFWYAFGILSMGVLKRFDSK